MHRVFSKELPQAALAHFESHDCHLQQLGAAKGVTCSLHKSCGHDEFCAMLTSRLRQEALFPECLDLSFPVISCFFFGFFHVFPVSGTFRGTVFCPKLQWANEVSQLNKLRLQLISCTVALQEHIDQYYKCTTRQWMKMNENEWKWMKIKAVLRSCDLEAMISYW